MLAIRGTPSPTGCYGIGRGHTEHSAIPKTSWETIDSFYVVGFGPHDVGSSRETLPRYRDVFVRPGDVLPEWPERPADAPSVDAPDKASTAAPKLGHDQDSIKLL